MAEQLKVKKVPWSQLEEYLKVHNRTIVAFQELLKQDMVDITEVEAKLPKSFSTLYSVIGKIFKDNNILPNAEESKVDQL
jgi:hypothetical protein